MQVIQPSIPKKIYYKIGEVAQLANLKTSVLRFWETEFNFLCPEKSSSGQRLYTKQDIELVCQIKNLLYKDKYTIEGVRKKFGKRRSVLKEISSDNNSSELDSAAIIRQIKNELLELRSTL